MISCEAFRATFAAGSDAPDVLAHVRECDRCLDYAATVDPDVMFRALGGGEMIPPGGVDAFVGEVMQQVRVRAAETTVHAHPAMSWSRRLAVAATLGAGITGAMLYSRAGGPATVAPPTSPVRIARAVTPITSAKLATKPTVETYQSESSSNVTIVEVPAETANDDVKIVMIFDENLPADL